MLYSATKIILIYPQLYPFLTLLTPLWNSLSLSLVFFAFRFKCVVCSRLVSWSEISVIYGQFYKQKYGLTCIICLDRLFFFFKPMTLLPLSSRERCCLATALCVNRVLVISATQRKIQDFGVRLVKTNSKEVKKGFYHYSSYFV